VAMDGERGTDSSTARTLEGIGLKEWVATDEDGYVARALALMDDPERLIEHRATSRGRLKATALMDYAYRTAELEKAYRLMWLNYLCGDRASLQSGVDLECAIRRLEPAIVGQDGDGPRAADCRSAVS